MEQTGWETGHGNLTWDCRIILCFSDSRTTLSNILCKTKISRLNLISRWFNDKLHTRQGQNNEITQMSTLSLCKVTDWISVPEQLPSWHDICLEGVELIVVISNNTLGWILLFWAQSLTIMWRQLSCCNQAVGGEKTEFKLLSDYMLCHFVKLGRKLHKTI